MSSNSEVRPLVLWNFELQTSETWMPDHDDKNSCEFYCPGTHGLFKVVRLKPKIHNFLVIVLLIKKFGTYFRIPTNVFEQRGHRRGQTLQEKEKVTEETTR